VLVSKRLKLVSLCVIMVSPFAHAQELTTLEVEMQDVLRRDAQYYSEAYSVSLDEAMDRLEVMHGASAIVDGLEAEFGETISGVWFENGTEFGLQVRLADGVAIPADRLQDAKTIRKESKAKGKNRLKTKFRSGGPKKKSVVDLLTKERAALLAPFTGVVSLSYDERRGELVIEAFTRSDQKRNEKAAQQISKKYNVPISMRYTDVAPGDIAGIGGMTYAQNTTGTSASLGCTSGFVVKNSAGKLFMTSAGHCALLNNLYLDGGKFHALANTPPGGLYYNTPSMDIAIITPPTGLLLEPKFKADQTGPLRTLTGRRSKTATTSSSSTATGSIVCFFGRNTGAAEGQICGEVWSTTFAPVATEIRNDCSNSLTVVTACNQLFVQVGKHPASLKPFTCNDGDSGAPWFALNTAFGIMKSSSALRNNTSPGRYCVYTSTDAFYDLGYSLAYGVP
jgi:hypothetical protein